MFYCICFSLILKCVMQSGMNGSNSNISDASGRAFPTPFSAQSGSSAAVLNHSGSLDLF